MRALLGSGNEVDSGTGCNQERQRPQAARQAGEGKPAPLTQRLTTLELQVPAASAENIQTRVSRAAPLTTSGLGKSQHALAGRRPCLQRTTLAVQVLPLSACCSVIVQHEVQALQSRMAMLDAQLRKELAEAVAGCTATSRASSDMFASACIKQSEALLDGHVAVLTDDLASLRAGLDSLQRQLDQTSRAGAERSAVAEARLRADMARKPSMAQSSSSPVPEHGSSVSCKPAHGCMACWSWMPG